MIRFSAKLPAGCLILALAVTLAPASDIFPYPFRIEQLDNGLKIVSIPLENPDIIAYYTIVRSGFAQRGRARQVGFAHFRAHDVQGDQASPPPCL